MFLKHSGLVRLVAFESAPCRDLVDDIVNETFVVFVSNPEKWDLTRPIQPLLRKIVHNISLQFWKKRMSSLSPAHREVSEILRKRYEEQLPTAQTVELDDRLYALDLCMGKLSVEQKTLLDEHYVQSLSFVELGEKYAMKPDSLQKRVSRLRMALERCVRSTLNILKGTETLQ
ncbi:MAG: sigma-70 family RNA polymerase sigma factor [Planctomycetia bacterium]|nr:sigma-70 family RNA polymerase sigma factor [Planctomycetia bacterium]